ncbi:MAG: 2'-5' RNA ligase family protein [Acidobacteria bacterium]|nr:2'-5' RNA ligase family protein [Acidobacteriota bacterium]
MLIALDLAILPPPEVNARAVRLSAGLPRRESRGLRLDEQHLPHVTLTQQFVDDADLDAVLNAADAVLRRQPPLALCVTGAGQGGRTVWMALERSAALDGVHERLMTALRPFERAEGTATAFHEGDARPRDAAWVRGYRVTAGGDAYAPHVTLGHATRPPTIQPFTFEATTVAACHLGRFCSCRRVLRRWELNEPRSHGDAESRT